MDVAETNRSNPYATQFKIIEVEGIEIETDQEGYIQDLDAWSEAFAIASARQENIELTQEHWDVIYYIRNYHDEHSIQATVRDMLIHFKKAWGKERGNNRHLHDIFPNGGPQKQGNRFAGVRRTKGEH